MKPSREPIAVVAAAAVAVTVVDVAVAVVVVTAEVVAVTAIAIVTNANLVGKYRPRIFTDGHGSSPLTVLTLSVLVRENPWLFSCFRFEFQAQSFCPTHNFNRILFAGFHLAQRSRVVIDVFNLARSDLHNPISGFQSGFRRR